MPVRSNDVADAQARGGVSFLSIFTGVLVALGTLFLLSAIVAGVIEALDDLQTSEGTVKIGVGAGIVFIVAQFIAYLWGGYTAGRMGRGAGTAHGFLVPLVALILAALVAGITTALGAAANLGLPFTETRFPVERNYLVEWGAGIGIGSLAAMFVGGIIGGIRGASWHSRLEAAARKTHEEIAELANEPPDWKTTTVYERPSPAAEDVPDEGAAGAERPATPPGPPA